MEELKFKNTTTSFMKQIFMHPLIACLVALQILVPITHGNIRLMNGLSAGLYIGLATAASIFILLYDQNYIKSFRLCSISVIAGLILGTLFSLIKVYTSLQLFTLTIIPILPFVLIILGLFLKYKNELDDKKLLTLFFMTLVWVELCYTLYISYAERSIDVNQYNFLASSYDISHTGYIKYIVDYGTIPNIDVRGVGQYYHPPLHHFICAYFFKAYRFIFPSFSENFEIVKFITLYAVIATQLSLYRIIKLFGVDNKSAFVPLALFAFQPHMFTSCANTNNDTLSTLFMFLAIERAIIWYRNRNLKNIILVALAIGLGMMAKLSVGIVAFPVAFLFLMAIFTPFDFEKFKKLLVQYIVFAVICIPLALWFQIKNYITHNVPITYLFGQDEATPFTNMSVWKRLFTPPVRFVIYQHSDDFENSVNVFVELIRTYIFSRYKYDVVEIITFIGTILFVLASVIAVIAVICVIYVTVKSIRYKTYHIEMISLQIMLISLMTSYVFYSCKFPYVYTMHFRYVASIVIFFAVAIGLVQKSFLDNNKKVPVIILTSLASIWMFFTYLLFQVMWVIYIY